MKLCKQCIKKWKNSVKLSRKVFGKNKPLWGAGLVLCKRCAKEFRGDVLLEEVSARRVRKKFNKLKLKTWNGRGGKLTTHKEEKIPDLTGVAKKFKKTWKECTEGVKSDKMTATDYINTFYDPKKPKKFTGTPINGGTK